MDRLYFGLYRQVGNTKVTIYARLRNLEAEDRLKNQASVEDEPFLADRLDKDDIMKRLGQHLDEESYIKMLSTFIVVILKNGQKEGVAFECKSLEKDLFIDYAAPINAEDTTSLGGVVRHCLKYRGPEAFMLDDNYRIGLHEYLTLYGVDNGLCAVLEQLVIVMNSKARDMFLKRLAEFVTQKQPTK